MVLTFINGVMMSFVQGYPVVTDAAHLDRRIQEMLRSITADRGPSTGAD
jgi:low affinity Fe/Cu permease